MITRTPVNLKDKNRKGIYIGDILYDECSDTYYTVFDTIHGPAIEADPKVHGLNSESRPCFIYDLLSNDEVADYVHTDTEIKGSIKSNAYLYNQVRVKYNNGLIPKDLMDPWYIEVIDTIMIKVRDIYDFFRYSIPNYLKNIWIWNRVIFSTRYFDYSYLLRMEKKYLEVMLKRYTENDYVQDQEFMVRDIRLMITLLNKITENDEDDIAEIKINMRNCKRFMHHNLFTRYMNEPSKRINRIYLREVRNNKIWNLYQLIRRYKLRELWD
jgi:hypothetical protein